MANKDKTVEDLVSEAFDTPKTKPKAPETPTPKTYKGTQVHLGEDKPRTIAWEWAELRENAQVKAQLKEDEAKWERFKEHLDKGMDVWDALTLTVRNFKPAPQSLRNMLSPEAIKQLGYAS